MNLPKTCTWHNRTVRHLVRCEVLTVVLLKIQAFWDVTLSGEQIVTLWSGVVPSSSKSSILRRMLVSWTHWPWRGRQDDPLKCWELLIQQYSVTFQSTLIYKITPFTSVLHYITISESFDKRQKTQLFINRTNHLVWMLSSMSTYSTQLDVSYSPSLDSFHISQSKCWGKDVDKVGSYCIFSYTDTFQDPRSKACVQSFHSEAVSFQHLSYNHRISRNTSFYTCDARCSRHSF